jgi:FK506-binding protein 1
MGVTKQTITPGDGTTKAKAGDTITMEYTGNLYDDKAPNKKGQQ